MKTPVSHRKYLTNIKNPLTGRDASKEVYEIEAQRIPEKTYRKLCRILMAETDAVFDPLIDDTKPIG